MLHLDFWNIAAHMINILLLCMLVKIFLLKPVNAVLEKRKAAIDEQFLAAEKVKEEVQAIQSRRQATVEEAQQEAQSILDAAKEKGRQEYGKIVQEAQQEAEAAMKKADLESKLMKEQALRQAEQEIAGLALSAASKILESSEGRFGQQTLYDEFLNRAGDSHDQANN